MQNRHQPLFPDCIYHLYSRAIGNEKLFIEEKNYGFFLMKLKFYTFDIANVYTYSLLPNHFHIVVKIKSVEEIIPFYEYVKKKIYDLNTTNIPDFVMERFSNFLNSYTKAFNKVYNRKGALFLDYLCRTKVEMDSDFTSFIYYTHKNAVHHGYVSEIGDWKFDAFASLLSEAPTSLLRNEVLSWFGGKQAFIDFHKKPVALKSADYFEDYF